MAGEAREVMTPQQAGFMMKADKDLNAEIVRVTREFTAGRITAEQLKDQILRKIDRLPGKEKWVQEFKEKQKAQFLKDFEAKRGFMEKSEKRFRRKAEKKAGQNGKKPGFLSRLAALAGRKGED
jgi:hypothetical protein